VGFSKLTEILQSIKNRYPALSNRLVEAEALSRWEKAVGPAIAKHSRAIQVKDGVLWVEVDHPVWKSELHHRKRQILGLLNQKEGSAIQDLLLLDPRLGSRGE
jgi:predicted nucleic acid-binding Zn ribbon protein